MPRTHLIYLESNIIFNAARTKFKYHQSPSKCDENNARLAMRRIYQASMSERTSLKITIVHWVKRKSAHSHHITRDQRPGGARASVGGEIDILHPGPGSNSPGASAADCSPIWRCPVLSPCYNRLLPKNRYLPELAGTQNPEHQTQPDSDILLDLETIYFTFFY